MSTKHYIVIAGILKAAEKSSTATHGTPEDMRQEIATALAEYFKQDNTRFDIPKFLAASGV